MKDKQLKLKAKDIPKFREELLKQQDSLCGMCGLPIESDPVVDHSHKSGHVRSVVHRSCNSTEGKLLNSKRFTGMTDEQLIGFLSNIISYWNEDYSQNPIHPMHKGDDEKELKALLKKKKMARKKETKVRLSLEIKNKREIIVKKSIIWGKDE